MCKHTHKHACMHGHTDGGSCVKTHMNVISSMPPRLDPHQFAYQAYRSTEVAIATALHSTLSLLEERSSYVRMLSVDFSSLTAFFRTDWCSNCQTWVYL